MDYQSKQEYRKLTQPRYQRAKKSVKNRILDEFCVVCGYHRKYAIALLKKPIRLKTKVYKKPGPKSHYQEKAVIKVLQQIWYEMDLACAK